MNTYAIQVLRIALLVLLLGSVLVQLLVPLLASQEATLFPEVAYLAVPYSVAAILFIACGQVALLAVWRLLSLVRNGAIFTRGALRWVDLITACAAVATALGAGVLFHLVYIVGAYNAVLSLGLAACLVGGLAFVLLMVVMRGLLQSAITDRAELDEVI
jgi:hypothetical protein